jgi:hypothetical protein
LESAGHFDNQRGALPEPPFFIAGQKNFEEVWADSTDPR